MKSGGDARWRVGAGAAVLLVLGAVGGGVAQRMVGDLEPTVTVPTPIAAASVDLVVDVQGAVEHPGVYRLREGARVLDALARAGGATDGAAPGSLNLARALVDGEQLLVPTADELAAAAGGGAGPSSGGGAIGAGGLISLNRADQATLETLPRVGPSLATAILAHRDEHGSFTDIAQLDDVPGIGPALLATLTPLVTL